MSARRGYDWKGFFLMHWEWIVFLALVCAIIVAAWQVPTP